MVRRPLRPSFSSTEQEKLIAALRLAREHTIKCSAAERYGSSRYQICLAVAASIDALGEELTGDAALFHLKEHSIGL